ncbi:hypothetical protein QBC37DRAFT_465924, partial [Rhypophila decipiens]
GRRHRTRSRRSRWWQGVRAATVCTAGHKAEFRWFELATAERNRLLAEMEAVERENGGDMPNAAGSLLRLADTNMSDDGTAASFRSWEIQDANYYETRQSTVVVNV